MRTISVDVQSRPHGKYRKRKQVVNKTDKIITGDIQQHQPDRRGNEIWDNEPTELDGNDVTMVKQPEEKIKQGGKHKNLYLIGLLYLFATGNSLVDLFCIASIYDCVSNLNFKEYSIALVFHLLRILFIGFQVIFLQVFIIALIKINIRQMKMLIIHLVGTNISIWIITFCQTTGILTGNDHHHVWEFTEFNCTSTDKSYFQIAKDLDNFLEPFILEFSLLSITILLKIYPRESDKAEDINKMENRYDQLQEFKCSPGLVVGILLSAPIIVSGMCINEYAPHYAYNLLFNYSTHILKDAFVLCISYKILKELKRNHEVDKLEIWLASDCYLRQHYLGTFLTLLLLYIRRGLVKTIFMVLLISFTILQLFIRIMIYLHCYK